MNNLLRWGSKSVNNYLLLYPETDNQRDISNSIRAERRYLTKSILCVFVGAVWQRTVSTWIDNAPQDYQIIYFYIINALVAHVGGKVFVFWMLSKTKVSPGDKTIGSEIFNRDRDSFVKFCCQCAAENAGFASKELAILLIFGYIFGPTNSLIYTLLAKFVMDFNFGLVIYLMYLLHTRVLNVDKSTNKELLDFDSDSFALSTAFVFFAIIATQLNASSPDGYLYEALAVEDPFPPQYIWGSEYVQGLIAAPILALLLSLFSPLVLLIIQGEDDEEEEEESTELQRSSLNPLHQNPTIQMTTVSTTTTTTHSQQPLPHPMPLIHSTGSTAQSTSAHNIAPTQSNSSSSGVTSAVAAISAAKATQHDDTPTIDSVFEAWRDLLVNAQGFIVALGFLLAFNPPISVSTTGQILAFFVYMMAVTVKAPGLVYMNKEEANNHREKLHAQRKEAANSTGNSGDVNHSNSAKGNSGSTGAVAAAAPAAANVSGSTTSHIKSTIEACSHRITLAFHKITFHRRLLMVSVMRLLAGFGFEELLAAALTAISGSVSGGVNSATEEGWITATLLSVASVVVFVGAGWWHVLLDRKQVAQKERVDEEKKTRVMAVAHAANAVGLPSATLPPHQQQQQQQQQDEDDPLQGHFNTACNIIGFTTVVIVCSQLSTIQ